MFDVFRQRYALDVLHDDIGGVVFLEAVVDLNNVRKVQLRKRLCFAVEASLSVLKGLRILKALLVMPVIDIPVYDTDREKLLDGHEAPQVDVPRLICDPEAAAAQRGADRIPAILQVCAVQQLCLIQDLFRFHAVLLISFI